MAYKSTREVRMIDFMRRKLPPNMVIYYLYLYTSLEGVTHIFGCYRNDTAGDFMALGLRAINAWNRVL